jgi:class 3 adenylate cyclase/tetratricopeptide (TPR) repeat protein
MSAPRSSSERLTPYLPRIAIDWLRETPAARHKEIQGSLAFVDISGFTQLTERLSRRGKVGAEEMNDLLDSCFTELLSVAYDRGAGVIKWGGDAVLLLFDGDEHEARACRAALEMQRTMRSAGRLHTSSGPVRLRMSVGIHSGSFDFFLVGGLHRELIVTGPAASTTVEMESVADAGEVALSPATAAALPRGCLGPAKGPAVLLGRSPAVESARSAPVGDVGDLDLGVCLPTRLREYLLAGGGEAEHRPMTAAFIHFLGCDEMLTRDGPDTLADALEQCLGTVQRVAYEHQVTFFETDIAPDGGKVMLMAGAPTSSGNDEERMLRALRAIVDEGGPLPMRVGVNRGRIFVADFGPPYRRTYSVKGDAVNLAARLMARAEKGQILATREVLERTRTAFDVVALEPFKAKGKAELVEAVAVGPLRGGTATGGAASTPLIGRERELAVLIEALDSARTSEGRLVEIVAEPGMGKSRLVEELLANAGDDRVVRVQCDEYETSTPYSAFRPALRDLLQLGDAADRAQAARLVRRRVQQYAPHLVPWLPLLAVPIGLELPETVETKALEERFRKTRLEEATRELVGMLCLFPTVFVVEDAHWLDDASSDLLRQLLRGLQDRPWLVVVTRRDQSSGFTAAKEARPATIRLEPLQGEEAAAFLATATEEFPLSPHELAALAERAGGNPLFLTELLAAARTPGGVDELPDSVEALMMAQIDRLSPSDRRVLRAASVVGASFSRRLVESFLGKERPDTDTWDRLAEFVLDDGGNRLRFRHALIRDAAYEGLPYRRRRELHGLVGQALERLARGRPEEQAEHLSLHFFNAHDFDRAWRYSRIAGERAQAIYANVEASVFFERALSAGKQLGAALPADVAAVSEALGDVRVRLGEFAKAGAAFRAARRRKDADGVERARLAYKEHLIAWKLGRYTQAMRWLGRGLRELEDTAGDEAGQERARLYAASAVVRWKQGRPRESTRWSRRAIAEAEASGAHDALAKAYYMLDFVALGLGQLGSVTNSERALAIYEELGDLERQATVLNNLGVFAHMQGRWDESVALYERAEQAWDQTGDRWSASFATTNRGEVLSDQGHLDDAEPLFRAALRVAQAAGSDQHTAVAAEYLGRLMTRRGLFEEAQELLASARLAYEAAGERVEVLATGAKIAECRVLAGDWEGGLELSGDLLARVAREEGASTLEAMLERLRGCALMQGARLGEAEASLRQSTSVARSASMEYEVALSLDALAVLGRLQGASTADVETERDAIFARLGVVSVPVLPITDRKASRPTAAA